MCEQVFFLKQTFCREAFSSLRLPFFFHFVYQWICLSVVVRAHFSLRTAQVFRHTHVCWQGAQRKTTVVQPLAAKLR